MDIENEQLEPCAIEQWLESKKNRRLIETLSCCDCEEFQSWQTDGFIDQIIQYRLSVSPNDGFDTDFCGRSALYLALRFNPSPESIRMLYRANKSALQTSDFFAIAPISLLYHDSYPLGVLKVFLDLCPENFITPLESISQKTTLKELDKMWSSRIQKENLSVYDLIKDSALRLQWEKFIATVTEVHSLLLKEGLKSPLRSLEVDSEEPSFSHQALAAIDLCGNHQLSTEVILLILKMYHTENENVTTSRRLISILSSYQPRKEIDTDGDRTLEAILLYRLWASPSEAFQSDHCGRTPLYHLIRLRPTVRSLRILYEKNTHALTTPDFAGVCPIALVYFRGCPIYVLQTLLALQPSAFMGGSPQELLGSQSIMKRLISLWNRLISTKSVLVSSIKDDGKLIDQWDKFMTTIQAANCFFLKKEPNDLSQFELHHILELRTRISFPVSLISFIIKMYPSQLSSMMVFNNRKMLPLHHLIEIFVSSKNPYTTDALCTEDFMDILKIMLDLFPEAAATPLPHNCSTLPLHMALEGNMKYNEGVSDIISKYPTAIHLTHKKTGLAPFMIASTTEGHDLETILNVLREAPSACPTVENSPL